MKLTHFIRLGSAYESLPRPCITTHITRMKELLQWVCGLVVSVSFSTFGSHEFDSRVRVFCSCYFHLSQPVVIKYIPWSVGLVNPGVTLPVARYTSGNNSFPSIVHPPTDSFRHARPEFVSSGVTICDNS